MTTNSQNEQTEGGGGTSESERNSVFRPSRRGILAGGVAGIGLAGLGSARSTGEETGRGEADSGRQVGGPPWTRNDDCKDDDDFWCSQGHQISPRRIGDPEQYTMAPKIARLNDNTLLIVYRPGSGHVSNDGHIVARLSEDWGETWGEPVTVADHPDYDTRNNSLIYDRESGRAIVHYRYYDAQSGEQHAELYKTSDDQGRTWSDPRELSLEYVSDEVAAPFGGQARTSNGLMKLWYGFDDDGDYGVVEALFSTDGGRTWGDNVLVGDSTDVDGRILTEPVPVVLWDDNVIVFGRDNNTADFYAIQSDDGGTTWGEPVYFSPTGMTHPSAVWVRKTNANELTAMWGDRTDGFLYELSMSARLAWQDPTLMADESVNRLAKESEPPSIGYPSFVKLGRDRRHTLVTFWDDTEEATNVWLMSLGGDSTGSGASQTVTLAGDTKILHGSETGSENVPAAATEGWDTHETKRIPIEFGEEFASPPAVNATIANAASGLDASTAFVSTDGFSLRIRNYRTESRPWACDWTAIGAAGSDE